MKTITVFFCLLFSAITMAREWPESRAMRMFPFRGKPRPDVWTPNGRAPQVGMYVGKGAWDTGIEHEKWFLQEHGFTYITFTEQDILLGALEDKGIRLLIMPGGESWEMLSALGEKGAERIREFVARGGGYMGMCAGAFYAVSHRQGGVKTGPYGIGLLEGTAYDGTDLHTVPFVEGMMDFDTEPDPLMEGFQESFRIVLLGGPSFHYTAEEAAEKNVHVLMRFQKIHEPAMITFEYGSGRVFLSGPHGEIEENRTDWGPDYYDPESEWPIWERMAHYLLKDGAWMP